MTVTELEKIDFSIDLSDFESISDVAEDKFSESYDTREIQMNLIPLGGSRPRTTSTN